MSENKKSEFSILDGYGSIAEQKEAQEMRELFMKEVLKIQNKTLNTESPKEEVVWSADSVAWASDNESQGELGKKMMASGGTDLSQVMNKITDAIDSKDKKVIITNSEPKTKDNINISHLDKLKTVLKTHGIENEPPEIKEIAVRKILKKV